MEQIPYDINDTFQAGWWKPIAKHGDNLYVAYTSPTEGLIEDETCHCVNVAKRDSIRVWTNFCLQSNSETAKFKDGSGHRQTAIAVDGSGRIHVFTSLHGNYWKGDPNDSGYGHYYRSDTPEDITSMVDRSTELPNQSSTSHPYRYTYPNICTAPNGDLYLIIRREEFGNAPMIMYRWDNTNSTWVIIGRVADTSDSSYNVFVYPDDIKAVDGKIHLAFSWHKNTSSSRRHRGSYLSYDPSTNQFKTVDGTTVTIPVDWSTPWLVYQPLTNNETTADDVPKQGLQSASLGIRPNGEVHLAYRYRAVDYSNSRVRHVRWTGTTWDRGEIWVPGTFEDSGATIEMNHDNVNVDIYYVRKTNGRNRLWVAHKDTTNPNWVHSQVSDLGIERICLDDGILYGVVTPYAEGLGKQFILGGLS